MKASPAGRRAVKVKLPVTVLTGFLGSGKTVLNNHILTANHGKLIDVMENELGAPPLTASEINGH